MRRQLLRAKVHRITVVERDLEYEGSLTLDAGLMQACGMVPYERIEVYDVTNGSRFATYVIEGPSGSGACCVNGAAAHMVEVGDKLILAAYCSLEESEVATHTPQVVFVGEDNKIKSIERHEQAGVRR